MFRSFRNGQQNASVIYFRGIVSPHRPAAKRFMVCVVTRLAISLLPDYASIAVITDKDMTVEIFALCQAATYTHQSICMLQTFENFYHQTEPVPFQGTCVLKIRFEPFEEGNHAFTLRLTNSDGAALMEMPFNINALMMPDGRAFQWTQLARLAGPLQFGDYNVSLVEGQKQIISTPLYVLGMP